MSRIWVEIDSGAFAHNFKQLKKRIGDGVLIEAVVKADGYGLGAVEAAGALLTAGADRLAVATVEEGIALREAGIEAPVQVLGPALSDEVGLGIVFDLILSVTSVRDADEIAAATKLLKKTAVVHLKIETGMGRFGLIGDDILKAWKTLAVSGRVEIEGAFTHFHSANLPRNRRVIEQAVRLSEVRKWLAGFGIRIPIWHSAASAGAILYPRTHMDMVRPGIVLHGVRNWDIYDGLDLRPVFSMHSRISEVRSLPAGMSVGYGATRWLDRETRVAVVAAGYADGYYRELSNAGTVIVEGVRCPVIGVVCMDAFMVNVSPAVDAGKKVERGTVATLVGENGGERIMLEELAAAANTNPYSLTCSLGPRIEKRYIKPENAGNVTEVDFVAKARKAG